MSDQEHIDVTSMEVHDGNDSAAIISKCGYCDCEKEGLPVFHCESCGKWFHTSCLRSGSPSPILFDNYYFFKCVCCSEDNKESFTRMRMTWNQVVSLALFNIAQSSPGNQGFHRWKDDVVSFVDKHWNLLFESYKKKTGNWINTIASTLSAGNPHQFTSGYGFVNESGWWKLTDPSIPPEYNPSMHDSRHREGKGRKQKSLNITSTPKLEGLRKRPYLSSAVNATQLKEKRSRTQKTNKKQSPPKEEENRDVATPVSSDGSPPSFNGCGSPISSPLSSPRSLSVTSMLSKGDMVPDVTLPLAILSDDSDMEQEQTKKNQTLSSDKFFSPLQLDMSAPTSLSSSPMLPNVGKHGLQNSELSTVNKSSRIAISQGNSAFSLVKNKQQTIDGRTKNSAEHLESIAISACRLQEMSLYEERSLLKKLESYGNLLREIPEAYRLHRKLLVRQKKRELNVPLMSFDDTVRRLVAKEKGIPLPMEDVVRSRITNKHGIIPSSDFCTFSPHHRILDRFQSPGFSLEPEMQSSKTFRQRLIGVDENQSPQPIISPYTQRILKHYVRRDFETKPPKLALLEEIVQHYHRTNETSTTETTSAPIDFCYVRPQHIPTINSMCHHFFWPGIDLSESLQYPDFSIVALYKKMIIGFGFMVPDVNFNEAYISFLLVHPDWQKAGLGTFMLYHLIQTCMGKDVTLHVSASNQAMLLYQKFGFKPEQFIADFYDKYHAVDSNECKHAFFMRLRR